MGVLIAEDEKNISDINEIIPKDAGHEVICTTDGEECLDLYFKKMASGRRFDMVITDLRMPKKTDWKW